MKIFNKRASFEYQLFERVEAGVVLSGGEAKAVRTGRADLSRSFAKIISGELYLINTVIPVQGALNYDPARTRKLLLHKKEITSIQSKLREKKLTLVPTSMYTKGNLVKVELALAKTKRKFEKREDLKKRDIQREIEVSLKGDVR